MLVIVQTVVGLTVRLLRLVLRLVGGLVVRFFVMTGAVGECCGMRCGEGCGRKVVKGEAKIEGEEVGIERGEIDRVGTRGWKSAADEENTDYHCHCHCSQIPQTTHPENSQSVSRSVSQRDAVDEPPLTLPLAPPIALDLHVEDEGWSNIQVSSSVLTQY